VLDVIGGCGIRLPEAYLLLIISSNASPYRSSLRLPMGISASS
jgi:hypothetical protein